MARSARWTLEDAPDLSGRTVVVTGGNSGIGYETALADERRQRQKLEQQLDQLKAIEKEFGNRLAPKPIPKPMKEP